jgi:hypothetical protein
MSRPSTASRYRCPSHSVAGRELDPLRIGHPHSCFSVEHKGTGETRNPWIPDPTRAKLLVAI